MPFAASPRCVLCLILLLLLALPGSGHDPDKVWTHDFAVELAADSVEAELVARTHGFHVIREIPAIKVFHFKHPEACSRHHRCKRHAQDLVDLLLNEPHVKRVEQQFVLERDQRRLALKHLDLQFDSVDETPLDEAQEREYRREVLLRNRRLAPDWNDPLFHQQWHLNNFGQFANPGLDLNLLPAWSMGYRGNGSRVVVVDDGIDTQHTDLVDNFDPILSADLNDPLDLTGNPRSSESVIPDDEAHGTKCAGEIAAKSNNKVCGAGVAPEATLGGIRVLAGQITDLLESYSILHQNQLTDIYSCSWGPKDNGKKMEMPHYYTGKALRYSATMGRKGLGNLFFYASGNGGWKGDNCGADAYVNSPFVMPISAVNVFGRAVSYGERCAATFATVPVGGFPAADAGGPRRSFPRIATCKINNRCTKRFMGTSAAAPLGAGCMALVLEANRKLSWRDAQHVLARSCRLPNPVQLVWQRNGAGFHVSHIFGFGLLDCSKAVRLAQTWEPVGPRLACSVPIFRGKRRIYLRSRNSFHFRLPHCRSADNHNASVNFIEHVLVSIVISHDLRGDLQLWLVSPRGTVSRLLGRRWPDRSRRGIKQTFLTRHLLGENPHGTWTVTVEDTGWRRTRRRVRGAVRSIRLRVFGTKEAPGGLRRGRRKARRMAAAELRETFHRERLAALKTRPLRRHVAELKRGLETGEAVAAQLRIARDRGLTEEERQVLREAARNLQPEERAADDEMWSEIS